MHISNIPLGWKPRQKLGIILEGGEGSLQRSLLPSYEMHSTIEGLRQYHAHKVYIPQIGNHQAHPMIHTISLMN